MARKGGFVPYSTGFRQVLNGGEMFAECDRKGAELARIASLGTGDYVHDTIRGQVRIHTRVKTADTRARMAERHSHRLERAARLMTTRGGRR